MRIFVAGATGAIGRPLVERLVAAGHEVTGTTTSPRKVDDLARAGATPVVLDALDGPAVRAAVLAARPDAVVHQLTALSGGIDLKRFDASFARTNLLRTRGLDLLLAAAREAGAHRFVAQSYAGWANQPGPRTEGEEAPLDTDAPRGAQQSLAAIRHIEQVVPTAPGLDGLALRYGTLYGPGTAITPGGDQLERIRARRFPVVGTGTGVWSFVHVDDAADATVAALDRGAPGVYTVVDDDPAPVARFLPELASIIGARPPRHVPTWLARAVVGDQGVAVMTTARGASNARARRELGWTPAHPSWREGFRTSLG